MGHLCRNALEDSLLHVRQQRGKDAFLDGLLDQQERVGDTGDAHTPLYWATDTDCYQRGALDLHIHGTIRDIEDFCVVLEGAEVIGMEAGALYCAVRQPDFKGWVVHAARDNWQLLVSV